MTDLFQATESLSRSKKTGAAIGAGFLLVVAIAVYLVQWQLSPMLRGASAVVQCEISLGSGAREVGIKLEVCGVIHSGRFFEWYTRLSGQASHLQAGTYSFSRTQSLPEIADQLVAGGALSTDIAITIPEGMNVWEIDDLLAEQRLIVAGSFARTYADDEGMLFPDTYRFDKTLAEHAGEYANARVIGAVLRSAFDAKARGYAKSQIIIASVLEKEAKTVDDMALVAGIIAERQKRGMALQIDATVAYGWCLARWLPMSSNRNCDVTQAPIATEIKVDGPYNTYTRTGLPKGPIANPGLKALEAAAHPKASPYLYYLSTRDGSALIYARTLSEHLANRKKYLGF